MLSLQGEKALFALVELAKKHYWQIYDTEIEGMIDVEHPEKNGFQNYRKYKEQLRNINTICKNSNTVTPELPPSSRRL